jgi:hypothetical protein
MSFYFERDIKSFNYNIKNIINEAQKLRLKNVEPNEDEIRAVFNIILEFISVNKRRIYGGYALDLLLREKGDKIYEDHLYPDIDFYSHQPVEDLKELCDKLYLSGYKNVIGSEALHKESYVIKVNNINYCNITYMPLHIYNKIQYNIINELNICSPLFLMVDYLRIINDPLISNWRLEKSFPRFVKLINNYPFTKINRDLFLLNNNKKIIYDIQKFLLNNETCITIGLYAYNYYLNESGMLENKNINIKKLPIPYYEIISSNFIEDSKKIIKLLEIYDITYQEYFPFFQFTGHSVYIYKGDALICIIYDNNKKAIPYHKININEIDYINIGSYMVTLQYFIIGVIKSRVDDDNFTKNLSMTLISYMSDIRDYYYAYNKNKSICSENNIFNEFVLTTMGKAVSPEFERTLIIESRKQRNKTYKIFRYYPENKEIDKELTSLCNEDEDISGNEIVKKYIFMNSSGNPILKDAYKKIFF